MWDSSTNNEISSTVPRFTIIIIDANLRASKSCAVFFIPSGRESEFQFSTQEGLVGIAGI